MDENVGFLTGVEIEGNVRNNKPNIPQQPAQQQQQQQKVIDKLKKPQEQKPLSVNNNQQPAKQVVEQKPKPVEQPKHPKIRTATEENIKINNLPKTTTHKAQNSTTLPKIEDKKIFSKTQSVLMGNNKRDHLKDILLYVQKDKVRSAKLESSERKKFKSNQDELSHLEKNSIIKAYQEKIVEDYNDIYKNDDKGKILKELKHLEKKQFLMSEISRHEQIVTQYKRKSSELDLIVRQKKKELEQIQSQIKEVDKLTNSNAREQYIEIYKNLEDINKQIEKQFYLKESLEFMVNDRKKRVNTIKSEIGFYQKSLKELTFQENLNAKKEKFLEENLKKRQTELQKRQGEIENYRNFNASMGGHFEEQLEDELSEFEDKRALDEIFKHQNEKKREKKEEIEAKRKEEQRKKDNERAQEIKALLEKQKKTEDELERWRQQFSDLIKATKVNEISKLLEHKENLKKWNEKIKRFESQYQDGRDRLIQEIKDLTNQRNQLKYEAKNVGKSDNKDDSMDDSQDDSRDEGKPEFKPEPRQDGKKDKNKDNKKDNKKENKDDSDQLQLIEKKERQLQQEIDKCIKQEQENSRIRKIINNICTVVSRVLYQLNGKQNQNKNIEVTAKEVVDQMSICCLKLEKYLAILSKKKDTIRVESVNTDSQNEKPPDFLGINPKKGNIIQFQIDHSQSILEEAGESVHFNQKDINFLNEEEEIEMQMLQERYRIKNPQPLVLQETNKKDGSKKENSKKDAPKKDAPKKEDQAKQPEKSKPKDEDTE